jgi:hypothetical protein
MKIAYWTVTGLFCLLMLAAAALETFGFKESAAFVEQLGYPAHVAYILPITKILGVIAILAKRSKTLKEWAYAGFFFDFLLAALAHYFSGVPSPIPALIALVLLMTSYWLDRKVYGGSEN